MPTPNEPDADAPVDVMILAGEASGDLHGARLLQSLRQRHPNMRARGMGAERLHAAGMQLLFDSRDIAVVGLWEVLRHWPKISRALRTIEAALVAAPPDLLILIDYVEFNLRMAAVAKRLGVKVLFYISPQIWAWRPERIAKIGALVDYMAVIFPFEVDYYRRAGIPVRYVGHPLHGRVYSHCSRAALLHELGGRGDGKLIGLLPGSRLGEIRNILPPLLQAARSLNHRRDDLTFILPIANGAVRAEIERQAGASGLGNLHLLERRAYDVMACADSIAIASGTATLEAALIGVPMAIVYKVNRLTWWWMRRKLQIADVGLANIVAGRRIVPEFIQFDCQAERIATELARQLEDPHYRREMCAALAAIGDALGDLDAASEVADLATEMLAAPAVPTAVHPV